MPRERRLFAVALTAARALGGQGFGLPLGPVVGSGNALHHSSDALVVGGVLAASGLMHRAAIRPVTDVPPENRGISLALSIPSRATATIAMSRLPPRLDAAATTRWGMSRPLFDYTAFA